MSETTDSPLDRMGDRFIRAGRLTAAQVEQVLRLQDAEHLRFGEAAVRLGFLTEQDVLAVLSEQFNYATAINATPLLSLHLSIAHRPSSDEAEAIRKARTNILALMANRDTLSIAIVSPRHGEGKTYLAASLAIAFSQAGQRTLLVNADLRNAAHDHLYGLAPPAQERTGAAGLSSILAGRASPESFHCPAGFPFLSVLDCGPLPPNPQELLNEPRLGNLLRQLHDTYEIIVIDTPPAGSSSDAQIIVRQSDACILVGRKDWSRLHELTHLRDSLQHTGALIGGVVYNTFPVPAAPGGLLSRLRRRLRSIRQP